MQQYRLAPRVSTAAKAFALVALVAGATLARAETLDEARKNLPDPIQSSGTLRVATSLQWAPFAYADENGQATGIDIELMKLLAQKLGLKAEFSDMKFPSIVPGISTGRYDAGVDQIGITDERQKVVDLIPYFSSQYGLLIKKGAPRLDVNKLCGHTLALTQGSAQVGMVEQLSAACKAAGQPEIGQTLYPSSADSYMAVANGRGEGFIAAQAVAIYIAKQNGKLEAMPEGLDQPPSLAGIVVGKQAPALKQALRAALAEAVKDGSYKNILVKYGVPESAYAAE